MIKFPDEIRLGVPDEHDEGAEIRVARFETWRDERDGRKTIDLQIELEAHEHHKLRRHLEQHSGSKLVKTVFELADPHGSMPPDPMGPALGASVDFINAFPPPAVPGPQQDQAVQAVFTPEYCLQQLLTLRGAVLAGFNGILPPTKIDYPAMPARPDNISVPGHPTLEAQVNRLLMATYSAASVIYGTETFTTTGYSAAMGLFNVIHVEFTP